MSSQRLTMPRRTRISPPAYSSTRSLDRSGSGSGRLIRVPLDLEHTMLDGLHVAEGAARGAPQERAQGRQSHEHGNDELPQGEIFDHRSVIFSPVRGSAHAESDRT